MKTTNSIEKALIDKIDIEIEEIVNMFIRKLKDIKDKYGSKSYYKITPPTRQGYDDKKPITCLGREDLRWMLKEMIKENHGEAMLSKKSSQLLAKLEIIW